MTSARLTAALLLGSLFLGTASAQTATPPTPTTAPAPATAPAAVPAAPANPAAIVATIGRENVTLAEYEVAFRIAVARVLNGQGVPFSPEYLSEFTDARAAYLTQYVRERAVYQLAKSNNKPDAAAIDAQLARARAAYGSDADYAEGLAQTGFTDTADLKAELERQFVVNAYLEGIKTRLKFGDALVAGFYNLNKASLTRDAEACASHILVKTQPEAQQIVKDLQAGGKFADIAKAKSQDPGSAADGGDLGCFGRGEMVEAFDRASFSGPLNAPQLVQTQFGWHVLNVTRRTEAGLIPLAEAAPLIREQLARDASQKYVDSQVARLNAKAFPEALGTPAAPAK